MGDIDAALASDVPVGVFAAPPQVPPRSPHKPQTAAGTAGFAPTDSRGRAKLDAIPTPARVEPIAGHGRSSWWATSRVGSVKQDPHSTALAVRTRFAETGWRAWGVMHADDTGGQLVSANTSTDGPTWHPRKAGGETSPVLGPLRGSFPAHPVGAAGWRPFQRPFSARRGVAADRDG